MVPSTSTFLKTVSKLKLLATGLVIALASCGGGTSKPGTSAPTSAASNPVAAAAPAPNPPTENEASRFLTQATYGATDAEIASVMAKGYAGWIDDQIATAPSAKQMPYLVMRNKQGGDGMESLGEAFLRQAAMGPDQLRLRMTFALSHIFVISGVDGQVGYRSAPMAGYWDTLHASALGNFRTLLETVSMHPEMGLYLSSWLSDKGNAQTGQQPDENFAREIMQLMTIGIYKLNPDGSRQLDGSGNPIAAYSHDDVAGLAKVFTGYYFYSPNPNEQTWGNYCFGCLPIFDFDILPMSAYPNHHSTLEKTFLGTTIPASTTPDPAGDLKIALDTLFNHPNTGPFIARRLIKQFVTSNPSPAYIKRVAAVFADNGSGTRGDLAAVIKAILLDREARDAAFIQDPTFGKLREPMLRLTGWMRAFEAISQTQVKNGPDGAGYLTHRLDSNDRFSQQPLFAPSVFDFWRADFSPPNSLLSAQGLEAPEFQIVDELSLTGYMNTIGGVVRDGVGPTPLNAKYADIHTEYPKETALATDEVKLVARVNKMLMAGQMSDALRQNLVTAVKQVDIADGSSVTADQINEALKLRVHVAVYLTMISPEYLAQR